MLQRLRTRSRIVAIGNSQGVRLPKQLLAQSGLKEDVELEVDRGRIIIHSASRPRQGWEEAFQAMGEKGDDRLLDEDSLAASSSWDEEEWEW